MATSVQTPTTAVEIRPEVTVLSVLRHLNYKAWFALAEFIDNSIQSFIANSATLNALHGGSFQLEVKIKIDKSDPGTITISDNAAGISAKDFPRAFRAAHVPQDRSGLSEFGMGMKSAACWFAKTWSVRTKAIGEPEERTISFDVKDIVEKKIERLEPEVRKVDISKHYTIVRLRGLHHPPQGRTLAKIRDHLASIYRVFLRNGTLKLELNDESLTYNAPKVLQTFRYTSPGIPESGDDAVEHTWQKIINLDFGEGQRVNGFAALREIGSTPLAGFSLFRRNRLIEGSFDETYRPSQIFKNTNSYPYQRIFGELHLEGFEVSHTKDGFRWEEFEDVFLDLLKEELEKEPLDLLSQAENYRALPSRRSIEKRAVTATNSVADYVEREIKPLLVEAKQNPLHITSLPVSLPATELQASEKTIEINDGEYRWIITLKTAIDPSIEEWLSLAKKEPLQEKNEDTRRLEINLSLAHPFSVNFLGSSNENIELLLRISAAISVALSLGEDLSGESPEAFLSHFNYLLRGDIAKENSSR